MRFSSPKNLIVFSILSLILVGCTTTNPNSVKFQPIASTMKNLPGQVIWREIVTTSPEQTSFFYSNVFGWKFTKIDNDYSLITYQGTPIAGLSKVPQNSNSNYWLPAISSENIDESISSATSAGAQILIDKTTLDGRGNYAVIQDPQGGIFSILNTVNGDPSPLPQKDGNWVWQEIWTQDIAKSKVFYQQIGNYKEGHDSFNNREATYPYFTVNGTPAFGFLRKPNDKIATTWVTYIKVDDIKSTAEKIIRFGGKVLMIQNETVKNSSLAIVMDPTGAGFVIQESR